MNIEGQLFESVCFPMKIGGRLFASASCPRNIVGQLFENVSLPRSIETQLFESASGSIGTTRSGKYIEFPRFRASISRAEFAFT